MEKKLLSQLKKLLMKRNESYVFEENDDYFFDKEEKECYLRKRKCMKQRGGEIVKSIFDGQIVGSETNEVETILRYALHTQHLINLGGQYNLEEEIQQREVIFRNGELYKDREKKNEVNLDTPIVPIEREREPKKLERWFYDRREAVRYAERWWNDYNPQYKKFEDNCTNFISQCLSAGGAPMTGYPNRSKGWWYQNNNWSFSWSVAHSLRWYLSGAQSSLRGQEMSSAKELSPGDIICYDFNGDGRWQHNTIVVAKDANGMPLVNAQTTNSRMRYWAYEDSTAWTPNIKYKFFHIVSDS